MLVYSLTTWAVWSAVGLALKWRETSSAGTVLLLLVTGLYLLLNWSYTVCAFTDPGSPLHPPTRGTYSELPTAEPSEAWSSITVKSGGGHRFCKKCQAKKPDRTHHCSTCRRCVLKMDHHCPWIATCVGFRNYKSFVLFITYVTLFCWVCFTLAGTYIHAEFVDFKPGESLLGVNLILLGVLAGIFGLVMTGFTGWHFHLAIKNQTTIECLETTRYLGTLQKTLEPQYHGPGSVPEESEGLMHKYGEQLREMHANSIPGVTRVEEGEERSSLRSGRSVPMPLSDMDYAEAQRERERQRYEAFLDEQDSESLPNAFDLGWRRNLYNVFGPNPLLWAFPVCNSIGDGFKWAPNPAWISGRETARQRREVQWKEQEARERRAGWGAGAKYPVQESNRLEEAHMEDGGEYMVTSNGLASVPDRGRRSTSKADRLLGRMSAYADEVPLELMGKSKRGQGEDTSSLDGLYDGGDEPEEARQGGDDWQEWK